MIWKIVNFGTALASFLAIAGVLALSDRLRPCQEGFGRWTSTLAIIGYSILAITNVSDYYMIQRLAMSTIVITLIVHPIWLIGTGLLLWRKRR